MLPAESKFLSLQGTDNIWHEKQQSMRKVFIISSADNLEKIRKHRFNLCISNINNNRRRIQKRLKRLGSNLIETPAFLTLLCDFQNNTSINLIIIQVYR